MKARLRLSVVLSAAALSLLAWGCGGGGDSTHPDADLMSRVPTEFRRAVEVSDSLLAAPPPAPFAADHALAYEVVQRMMTPDTRAAAVGEFLEWWDRDPGNIMLMDIAWVRRRFIQDMDTLRAVWDRGVGEDSASARALFAEGRTNWRGGNGALESFQAAEEVAHQLSPFEVVFLQERIALAHRSRKEFGAAIATLLPILPDAWRTGGAGHAAAVWIDVAKYAIQEGGYDRALLASRTAKRCAALSDDPYRRLIAGYTEARILARQGRYHAAMDSFITVYGRAEAIESASWMSRILGRQFEVAGTMGDPRGAMRHLLRGLDIAGSVGDTLSMVRRHSLIATNYLELGERDSSRVHLDAATSLLSHRPDDDARSSIDFTRHLHALHHDRVAEADSLRRVLLANPAVRANPILLEDLELGVMEQGVRGGRPDLVYRSMEYLRDRRDSFSQITTNYNATIRYSLLAAEFLAQRGEYGPAFAELDAADLVEADGLGAEDRWTSHQARGRIAVHLDDLDAAAGHFEAALELAVELEDPSRMRRSRIRLGQVLLDRGDAADAGALFVSSVDAPEYWTRFAAALYTGMAEADQGRHAEALEHFSRALAMLGDDAPDALRDRLTAARCRSLIAVGRHDQAYDLVVTTPGRPGGARALEADMELRSFYRAVDRERVELLVGLLHDHPGLSKRGGAAEEALEALGSLTDGGETGDDLHDGAELRYFLGEDRGFVWERRDGRWRLDELDDLPSLDRSVRDVVSDMSHPGRQVDWAGAQTLAERLMGDAVGGWEEGTPLRVACDGVLHDLPWAALPLPGGEDGRLLVDHGPVVRLVPGADSVRDGGRGGGRALVVGVDGVGGGDSDPRLRQAELEAHEVASLFPTGAADLLTGSEASWSAILGTDLGSYGLLHVATHARLSRGRSGASTIRFSEGDDDRPVTADELEALSLGADLVYLSCCEGGKASGAGNGLDSLSDALLRAGAGAVIASTLHVDDEASRGFAGRFYGRWLSCRDAAAALAATQREIRDRGAAAGHPFHWAFMALYEGGD